MKDERSAKQSLAEKTPKTGVFSRDEGIGRREEGN
jgi:hypothetical protein